MQENDSWYGWPIHPTIMFTARKVAENPMTALALSYSPTLRKFAVAADGLSTAATDPQTIDTHHQQKIFSFQHKNSSLALAIAGFGRTKTNSFNTVLEATKQMEMLIKRPFQNGYELAYKFRFNMIKILENALREGRVSPFTSSHNSTNKVPIFIFYVFGYFNHKPFWVTADVYYDISDQAFSVIPNEPDLRQFQFASTGSYPIQLMFYGKTPFDSRLADREYVITESSIPIEAVHKFVETCCLPVAREVDKWCQGIGGHIHAAEISALSFEWAIPPI